MNKTPYSVNQLRCRSGAPPEITLVLDRLRSAHNTGNIFRIAEAVGAREIIACGYTPAPGHPKLAKTAMGADSLVSCRQMADSISAVQTLRTEGIRQILAVEALESSVFAWDFKYQFPLALVFGNEALGIAPETLAACDGTISLPMFGVKASINVGNCAAAVLYAVIAQNNRSQP
ncbi:MAG: TrmH family RNA methyltransferase [Victivallaceae bacterium]|jgi:tRNA G18 (ribose-2'-O)-methylase SpoU|nr:TrmH family RNA methyltransferase [Victivallaceae bacterium]MDD3703800.1 TrmH family RNA methyltransferase [Victivallaceae bacterium]MDD4318511.1 TrmH family RNA methyltransferase [Victivallaceae bacterium]MDD5662788.1 TrmH family RNA methyltransferase [Victivallaceae bacterium]NLK83428.1 RNA methyltransferase [Lentisphaerota bacterium]